MFMLYIFIMFFPFYIDLSLILFYTSLIIMIYKFDFFLEWNLFNLNSVNFSMFIYIDWMSLMFMFTVLLISSMIMFFCIEYMSHDNYSLRFFMLMFFFIMSMLLMILSPNMISILLGWDGLGLVSYCLVIYYQNFYSYNSGMLTVLLNRIGDLMLMMSISIMMIYGTFNFYNLNKCYLLLLFFIMIASFTKSAQFPFSSWLPVAMAAPTPVSSLVHSSTLVTAGIYLLIRFNYMMYLNNMVLFYIMLTGILTMFMSGMSANMEFDMKKIIAYSTLSQLGLMMMIYGMKNYELVFFHLIIHAMFKSMMFMCSGVMIHTINNIQDIRFLGKLKDFMPLTSMMFMISNFSLCGMPFMSGFYSKDYILEFMMMNNLNLFIYMIMLSATGLTVLYSLRLMYYLMNSKFNFLTIYMIKDNKMMNYSMLILMFLSIMFGMFMNWILFMNIELIYLFDIEKNIIIIMCVTLMFFSIKLFKNLNYKFMYKVKYFYGKMWFLYNLNMIILYPLMLGKFYFILFDKGWSEYYFKNIIYKNFKMMDFLNYKLFNNYLAMIMMSLFIIIMFIMMI